MGIQTTDPPRFYGGQPPILDKSYTRVQAFGKKPGGAKPTSSAAVRPGLDKDGDEEGDEDEQLASAEGDAEDDPVQPSGSVEDPGDGQSNSGDEWEYEYEDLPPQLVIFDIGLPEEQSRKLLQTSRNLSIVGLETNRPFMRVGNTTFMGQWEESIGTGIVLQDDKDPSVPFPHQHHPSPLPPPLPSMTHAHVHFTRAVDRDAVDEQAHQRLTKAMHGVKARGSARKGTTKATTAEGSAAREDAEGGDAEQGTARGDNEEDGSDGEASSGDEGSGAAATSPVRTVRFLNTGDGQEGGTTTVDGDETKTKKVKRMGRPPMGTLQKLQKALDRAAGSDTMLKADTYALRRIETRRAKAEKAARGKGPSSESRDEGHDDGQGQRRGSQEASEQRTNEEREDDARSPSPSAGGSGEESGDEAMDES